MVVESCALAKSNVKIHVWSPRRPSARLHSSQAQTRRIQFITHTLTHWVDVVMSFRLRWQYLANVLLKMRFVVFLLILLRHFVSRFGFVLTFAVCLYFTSKHCYFPNEISLIFPVNLSKFKT